MRVRRGLMLVAIASLAGTVVGLLQWIALLPFKRLLVFVADLLGIVPVTGADSRFEAQLEQKEECKPLDGYLVAAVAAPGCEGAETADTDVNAGANTNVDFDADGPPSTDSDEDDSFPDMAVSFANVRALAKWAALGG